MRTKAPSKRLTLLNTALSIACAVFFVLLLRPPLVDWTVALRSAATYQPHLPNLWLLVPLTVGFGIVFVEMMGRGGLTGSSRRYLLAAQIVLLGAFFGARMLDEGRRKQAIAASKPPAEAALDALRTLSTALEEVCQAEGKDCPEEASGFLEQLELSESPWRSHGRRLGYRVLSSTGTKAVLQSQEGDLPGTFYYVRSHDRTTFWMTALVLEGAPTGETEFLSDPSGRTHIEHVTSG